MMGSLKRNMDFIIFEIATFILGLKEQFDPGTFEFVIARKIFDVIICHKFTNTFVISGYGFDLSTFHNSLPGNIKSIAISALCPVRQQCR